MTEKCQPPQDIRKTFRKGEKYYKEIAKFTITISDATLRGQLTNFLIKVEDDAERSVMIKTFESLLKYNEEQLLGVVGKFADPEKAATKIHGVKEEYKKDFVRLTKNLACQRLNKIKPRPSRVE